MSDVPRPSTKAASPPADHHAGRRYNTPVTNVASSRSGRLGEQDLTRFHLRQIHLQVHRARLGERLAGRVVEHPLVQWAFDLAVDDEAVGEARVLVGAGVVRGEDPPADVVEADRLAAKHDRQRAVLRYVGCRGYPFPLHRRTSQGAMIVLTS